MKKEFVTRYMNNPLINLLVMQYWRGLQRHTHSFSNEAMLLLKTSKASARIFFDTGLLSVTRLRLKIRPAKIL